MIDFSSEKCSGSTGHRRNLFAVRMSMVRLELATPGLQTQCSSHWVMQLKRYCWEGVEFEFNVQMNQMKITFIKDFPIID